MTRPWLCFLVETLSAVLRTELAALNSGIEEREPISTSTEYFQSR